MRSQVSDNPQPMIPVLHSQFDEVLPRFSPDGHWLAYVSNDNAGAEKCTSFPIRPRRALASF